ncbi:hypothetical protein PoB_001183800 [Plakobranchus ocellatus]|uniref:Uncharacterized protein n=1 Tax=Plakobranchus ocellatus TaxID=259542 RepID=A0AAV3YSI8_9GAST|nr:hypothetical protein PoB_001183800 [Plakobranchus ocellatus]
MMTFEEKMVFAWIFLFFSAIVSVHGAFKTGSDFHRSDTAGNRLSYANTDNIGDCARLCLGHNTSCLLIFWSVQNLLPEGNAGENCGPQGTSLSWSDIDMLKTIGISGLKIYMNSGINSSQPSKEFEV